MIWHQYMILINCLIIFINIRWHIIFHIKKLIRRLMNGIFRSCRQAQKARIKILKYRLIFIKNTSMCLCSCQVRNKKKLIFFINGEPLARFPMLLLYNFVFSLLLLIIPSSSLKVIKVPSDFNMLIIIHQHIINEISDYFFIKLIQLTKLC